MEKIKKKSRGLLLNFHKNRNSLVPVPWKNLTSSDWRFYRR